MHAIIELFLKSYLSWVQAGHPETKTFVNRYGLCGNLAKFLTRLDIPLKSRRSVEYNLTQMFYDDKLDVELPFDIGLRSFRNQAYNGKLHKNPERIAWVKSKVPDWEPEKEVDDFLAWLSNYPSNWGGQDESSRIRWAYLHGQESDGNCSERFTEIRDPRS